MTKLILIRHGESTLNQDGVYFGTLDPSLTETGIEQINLLKDEVPNYDFIYSSPLQRAKESAEILNYKNLNLIYEPRLLELDFGDFEGLTYSVILKKYPNEAQNWKNEGINYKFPKGDSITDLEKSVVSFVEEIKNSNKIFLLVTHFGVISSILSHYISDNITNFWKFKSDLASITILEFHDSFPVLRLFSQKKY